MKELLVSNSKKIKLDDDDYEKVKVHHWTYAYIDDVVNIVRNEIKNGKSNFFYLHRVIFNLKKGEYVYFKDKDRTNFLRNNIIICNITEIKRSYGPQGKKKYKGVHKYNYSGKYKAVIQIGGRENNFIIGVRDTEEKAAKLYDSVAHYISKFSYLNFPNNVEKLKDEKLKRKIRRLMNGK